MGKRESTIFDRASEFFRKERSRRGEEKAGTGEESLGTEETRGGAPEEESNGEGEGACKTKVCPKCGRELPITAFNKDKSKADGHSNMCRDCISEYGKVYRERKKRGEDKDVTKMLETKPETRPEVHGKTLADYTPRELMLELYRRGYEGELVYVEKKTTTINLKRLFNDN